MEMLYQAGKDRKLDSSRFRFVLSDMYGDEIQAYRKVNPQYVFIKLWGEIMFTIMYQGNKQALSFHETKDGGFYFYIMKNTEMKIEKFREDNPLYQFFNLT